MSTKKNLIGCTNKALVAFFTNHGIQPDHLETGYNDTLIFLYDKDESQDAYNEWCANGNRKNTATAV